jgi:hypothetical protein
VEVVTGSVLTGLADGSNYKPTLSLTSFRGQRGMALAARTLPSGFLATLPNSSSKSYTLTYSSSNTSILSVTANGSSLSLPTRQVTGEVRITATVVCNFTGQTFTRNFYFKVG